ncbi:MAG: hypothetical protein B6I37_07330 [Desulfobacteraceae bacterium 4572_35.2]|nr:MAG: hypothetical protein B6I37_07330 [Desulfobacteraceae bacterium 4572_35.2]
MSHPATYEVKVDTFEGPLDLLLHLVTKNEMDINDIPLAQITSQYLNYLDQMEAQNLDVASEFLVMAATLIHIKSKLLLPRHANEEEVDEDELDPRVELVQRLLEYRRYKEGAEQLSAYPQLNHDVFSRPELAAIQDDSIGHVGGEHGDIGLFELVVALRELLKEPAPAIYHDINTTGLTVDEATIRLRQRLKGHEQLLFRECFVYLPRREEVVVMFIALLELVKRHECRVVQLNPHGSIYLYPVH